MPTITITILGKPIAQRRPRFARVGKYVRAYSDQKTEAGKWIAELITQIKGDDRLPIPAKTPVALKCEFIFPPLKSFTKKQMAALENGELMPHVSKPDADNLVKMVQDCLTKGAVYHDDAQVWRCIAEKRYGLKPQTIIDITW